MGALVDRDHAHKPANVISGGFQVALATCVPQAIKESAVGECESNDYPRAAVRVENRAQNGSAGILEPTVDPIDDFFGSHVEKMLQTELAQKAGE